MHDTNINFYGQEIILCQNVWNRKKVPWGWGEKEKTRIGWSKLKHVMRELGNATFILA